MGDTSTPPFKSLSHLDWETLIDDFHHGGSRFHKWTSLTSFTPSSLLDLSLSLILKRDFSLNLKLQILLFLDEFLSSVPPSSFSQPILDRLLDTLRLVLQSPTTDALHITFSLKEHMMVSTTSILISIDAFQNFAVRLTESLVELLLTVVNRPNFGPDRQTRAVACECLRELERAYPCLLSEVAGHLWGLCQSERTHASQSYILLFTTVLYNIVAQRSSVSILNTSIPLVPFNAPQSTLGPKSISGREVSSGLNSKELKRAVAFLLEWPQVLTPCAMMEFMDMIMCVAVDLELQASMLKVQFSGMIYSFDPMLCHIVLMMYLTFLDVFEEQKGEFSRRLVMISNEAQLPLVYRLLALHWLLGFTKLRLTKDPQFGTEKNSVVELGFGVYPTVFDPLALKALKFDLLALGSILGDEGKSEVDKGSVVKFFHDGLVSVSAFKWLPPGSTETAVAFRSFHKFLIGRSSHLETEDSSAEIILNSDIFRILQGVLVELMLENQKLVPVVVAFTDRLLGCHKHRRLGEGLLQTFNEHLLPRVAMDYNLVTCFPVFDRIAENNIIPPQELLGLLSKFMLFLVKKQSLDTGMKSWSRGSMVLGICRTMMMHHYSSSLFLRLSHLLAFTCLYFPDLEVRDNARIYLRMLICIPGKKLRAMLDLGDQLLAIAPPPHPGSMFSSPSAHIPRDLKKYRNISSYVHFERKIPLLVKQSWSLSLSNLGLEDYRPGYLEGVNDGESPAEDESPAEEGEADISSGVRNNIETDRINRQKEPLRVIDSKISAILVTLRRHFSCIPDFRHMVGLKVKISCGFKFESEPFNRIWGSKTDNVESLPAMYATTLKFSSSAPYGRMPSSRIPFLLGEPPRNEEVSLDIVTIENDSAEDDCFEALVAIELEPREPTPGLIDIVIESNAENGQIIHGQLQSISIGIEDMFMKATVPLDLGETEIPSYYSDLFNALWEACGASSNSGRETFPLKGGKGVAAISGTRSVKLLQVPASSLIRATELHLSPFVVTVVGDSLINIVKDGGIIRDVIWKNTASDSLPEASTAEGDVGRTSLYLTYYHNESTKEIAGKSNLGCFFILIFLPPRFHLLFQMEVSDFSTLVRIRTDHWPCLAYIDEYLEALYV